MTIALPVCRSTACLRPIRLAPTVPEIGSWSDRRKRTGSAKLGQAKPHTDNKPATAYDTLARTSLPLPPNSLRLRADRHRMATELTLDASSVLEFLGFQSVNTGGRVARWE